MSSPKIVLILYLSFTYAVMTAQTIIDFKENPTTQNWTVVDDVVMGGRSVGKFAISNDGYGKFYGEVSLENNGGFSSVRYHMAPLKISPESTLHIKLKGDEKTYQFRVKAKKQDYYSYITTFKTTGNWQTLQFKLKDLYPTFRGRNLDLPNFDKATIEEFRFLIGNKKPQEFELLLASIKIES